MPSNTKEGGILRPQASRENKGKSPKLKNTELKTTQLLKGKSEELQECAHLCDTTCSHPHAIIQCIGTEAQGGI